MFALAQECSSQLPVAFLRLTDLLQVPHTAMPCRSMTTALLCNPDLFNGAHEHCTPIVLAVLRRLGDSGAELELQGPRLEVHLGRACAGCDTCMGPGFLWKIHAVAFLLAHLCECPCRLHACSVAQLTKHQPAPHTNSSKGHPFCGWCFTHLSVSDYAFKQ